MKENTIALYTAETEDELRRAGATEAWRASVKRATKCEYGLLARNARRTKDGIPNGEYLAIVRGLSVAPSAIAQGRVAVRFREIAQLRVPDGRRTHRQPVTYGNLNALLPGVDLSQLDWRPL